MSLLSELKSISYFIQRLQKMKTEKKPITGCTDKKTVRTMAQIIKAVSEYCSENLITDGCCGVRELISWVQSYMVCGDVREAAHYTILSSVSADAESRSEVENGCLDSILAA